jgi:hypothetical protein
MWRLALISTLMLVSAVPKSDSVDFQLLELDSPISSLKFCGEDSDTILVITQNNSVYRSDSYGSTWRKLNDMLQREASKIPNSSATKVTSFELSRADPSLIVMIGNTGINWISEDCGKTVQALNQIRAMDEFRFHPTERNWGLAASWTKCSDFVDQPCRIVKELYATRDLGKTWQLVTNYVVQFAWGKSGLEKVAHKQLPKERIYVTRIRDGEGHQTLSGWTNSVDLLKSDDFFLTSEVLVPRGNKFVQADRYILVAQVSETDNTEVSLLISNIRNIETFYKAELPVKHLSEHSYTILDTSEESIFLNINHYGDRSKYGNVYVSDELGRKFSLSLLHNVRNVEGYCDFDKVYGLEGIFIANVYDKDYTNKEFEQLKNEGKKTPTKTENPELSYKQTVITFDKGGVWQNIPAPERDSLGKKVICEETECYLHLHSISYQRYGPFYSVESASGIIIATGNIGSHLSHKPDKVNTYLSRDGGFSWTEVRKGSHIYEIGDHGGLIVMADDQKATDTVFYSWNEGLSWESIKVSDKPIEVENIIIEPEAVSTKFILYGTLGSKGVTVSLDFGSLHEPQCKNPDLPGSSDSDYEVWTPHDGRTNSKCLMGRRVDYVRRKRDSECYNGEEFERKTFVEECECTEMDYVCDYGYFREGSGACSPVQGYVSDLAKCQEGDQFYEIPTGYRKVAGNTCVGGVASRYDPTRILCSDGILSGNSWILLSLIVVVLIGLVYKTQSEKINEVLSKYRGETIIDRKGYTSDFNRAPETMLEEESIILHGEDDREDEFNPRA